MNRPVPLNLVPYSQVRNTLCRLDIGLVHTEDLPGTYIQWKTNGPYGHAMVLGWEGGSQVLQAAESTYPESRVVAFSSRVKHASGRIDIYQLKPEIFTYLPVADVWAWYLRGTGVDYPLKDLLHDWQEITWPDRTDPIPNSDDPEYRRVCSGFIHAGLRIHGVLPIRPYDCDVYPATLCDPAWVDYICTPVYDL